MSGEVLRHHPGSWLGRTFAVGDCVRLKHDMLLGIIADIERSDRPRGNGWICAYRVRWDGDSAGATERCHPAQLMPAAAPMAEDDDER
jgi:hypothetical protein